LARACVSSCEWALERPPSGTFWRGAWHGSVDLFFPAARAEMLLSWQSLVLAGMQQRARSRRHSGSSPSRTTPTRSVRSPAAILAQSARSRPRLRPRAVSHPGATSVLPARRVATRPCFSRSSARTRCSRTKSFAWCTTTRCASPPPRPAPAPRSAADRTRGCVRWGTPGEYAVGWSRG